VGAPLTSLECDLLEAVVRDPARAAPVLADYWIENGAEARGAFLLLHYGDFDDNIELADEEAKLASHTIEWRAAAIENGFPPSSLWLSNGFLQWPIAVEADGPLDGDPDIVRLSPKYIRELRLMRHGGECVLREAEMMTPRTRTRVAVKSLAGFTGRAVLDREYAILSRLEHPNISRLIGPCLRRDGLALVLAWGGIDLATLLALAATHEYELGVAFALSVGAQLLEALAYLHRNDVVHLEVRSDHVLVANDGTVTLIDFGYVRCDMPRPNQAHMLSPPVDDEVYRFRYMSPEQCRGTTLDGRSDVFSAVGVISELVAGVHPVTANEPFPVLQQIAQQDLMLAPQFPEEIASVLHLGHAREPQNRAAAWALHRSLVEAARVAGIEIGPHVIAQVLTMYGVPA